MFRRSCVYLKALFKTPTLYTHQPNISARNSDTARNSNLIAGRSLKILDDVALDGYIRAAGDTGAITASRRALMPLGQQLLKDRQDRKVEQFAIGHSTVHLRDVHCRATDNIRTACHGPGHPRAVTTPTTYADSAPSTPATWIRAREFVVVYRSHVRRTLHILQTGLLAKLRLGVPALPYSSRSAMGTLVYGMTLGPQTGTLLPRPLGHRALNDRRYRLLVFFWNGSILESETGLKLH